MSINLQVQGSLALERKLRTIGKKARAASRRGLSAGGKFATKMFKWTAPVATGATRKSIGIVRVRNAEGADGIFVGVRKNFVDKKSGKQPILYSWLVERYKPWYVPTWQNIKARSAQVIIEGTYKAIDDIKMKQ